MSKSIFFCRQLGERKGMFERVSEFNDLSVERYICVCFEHFD